VSIFAGVRGFLDKLELSDVTKFEAEWLKFVRASHPEILTELRTKQEMSKELDAKITQVVGDFVAGFSA